MPQNLRSREDLITQKLQSRRFEFCKADHTTWKLTLQDIKTERGCSRSRGVATIYAGTHVGTSKIKKKGYFIYFFIWLISFSIYLFINLQLQEFSPVLLLFYEKKLCECCTIQFDMSSKPCHLNDSNKMKRQKLGGKNIRCKGESPKKFFQVLQWRHPW